MTDSCKHFKEQLSRNQAIINRFQQSGSAGSAAEGELRTLETSKEELEEELAHHKTVATQYSKCR